VLIDDRADNCAAFTGQGGAAIQWKMGTSHISDLTSRLRQWLDQSCHTAAVGREWPARKSRRSARCVA